MSEFMLLFRRDVTATEPSQEQMMEIGKKWWAWRSELESKKIIVSTGNRLSQAGKVVKANAVTDGPYAEIKECLAGYMVINAENFDEAVAIAKACPVLLQGGNVEVRKFIAADDNVS